MATDKEIEAARWAIHSTFRQCEDEELRGEKYPLGFSQWPLKCAKIALTAAERVREPNEADMRAFSASDEACYRWPEDSWAHRALRAAFIDGAAAARPGLVHASEPDCAKHLLRQLIDAIDAGQLEMNSPEIQLDENPPHPWHEEWLHHARACNGNN